MSELQAPVQAEPQAQESQVPFLGRTDARPGQSVLLQIARKARQNRCTAAARAPAFFSQPKQRIKLVAFGANAGE